MSATLESVLCLHAKADDLGFLNPVRNSLMKILGVQGRLCELRETASHHKAIDALAAAQSGLAVIFAHGTDSFIHGGEYLHMGELNRYDRFITRENLQIFKGKAIFCLSCHSDGLARSCIDAGAQAFVGFGSIPFTQFDAITQESVGSHALQKHCQTLIAEAVKATLKRFILGRSTLDQSVDYLKIWITKRAVDFVRNEVRIHERREIAALFLRVRDGACYHGPLGIRFDLHG